MGRTSSNLGRQPDPERGSHSRAWSEVPRPEPRSRERGHLVIGEKRRQFRVHRKPQAARWAAARALHDWSEHARSPLTPSLSPPGRGRPLGATSSVLRLGRAILHPLLPAGEKVPEGRMRGDSASDSRAYATEAQCSSKSPSGVGIRRKSQDNKKMPARNHVRKRTARTYPLREKLVLHRLQRRTVERDVPRPKWQTESFGTGRGRCISIKPGHFRRLLV